MTFQSRVGVHVCIIDSFYQPTQFYHQRHNFGKAQFSGKFGVLYRVHIAIYGIIFRKMEYISDGIQGLHKDFQ